MKQKITRKHSQEDDIMAAACVVVNETSLGGGRGVMKITLEEEKGDCCHHMVDTPMCR